MREEDLALARRWLLEPHVRRWWNDDPEERDYPEGTLEEWRVAINGDDPTDMFLIAMEGRPIGVIQSYRVDSYPDYVQEVGELAEPAFSLDVFIGEPELIGKGLGVVLLRAFLPPMFERYRVDYCVIGPARSNVAAIRSYEKAGFRYLKDYREEDTTEPEHMLLDIRRRDIA
jgi:aminoglycoside 6'-N-acetyltransferase